jgi:uncharacterized protein YndB with AHSA1/START domain
MTPNSDGTSTAPPTRSTEVEIEIAAPVDVVWRALVEADELSRWFPLEARVTPGAGGSIWLKWDDQHQGEWPIRIWEPSRYLRTSWAPATSELAGASPERSISAEEPVRMAQVATDFFLEGRGGTTVLRVVSSGFGLGASWDELYDGVSNGWQFELRGLRHYLERHRGQDRVVAWTRATYDRSHEEAWQRLVGAGGWVREGRTEGLQEGDPYEVVTATGDMFRGSVHICNPPRQFSGTVANWNDGLLRVHLDRSGAQTEVILWLSTYGVPRADIGALQERWQDTLRRLYATTAETVATR